MHSGRLSLPPLAERDARTYDLVGLGESSLDVVAVLDGHPPAGSKQTIRSLSTYVGGQVATAAVACARLGWRTRFIGSVGSDPEGAAIVEALESEGVNARIVRRDGRRSRTALILVDRLTGGRTVLEHRDPALALAAGELNPEEVRSGRVLLVDATDPVAARRAAAVARAAGIPVVLDVERVAVDVRETASLLESVDVAIMAEAFPTAYTGAASLGEALRLLQEHSGVSLVVATLGSEGSLARHGGTDIRTAAFPVDVVDTTGAGDAFRGGFIAGWLRYGPNVGLHTLLEYANAVAALNCRRVGAQTGLPTEAEVDAFVTGTLRGESK